MVKFQSNEIGCFFNIDEVNGFFRPVFTYFAFLISLRLSGRNNSLVDQTLSSKSPNRVTFKSEIKNDNK
ncbi:unnamed protein product, partial [Nesidiocoris tenuis]